MNQEQLDHRYAFKHVDCLNEMQYILDAFYDLTIETVEHDSIVKESTIETFDNIYHQLKVIRKKLEALK